jgi:SAM-dependent methyltransferase
MSQAPEPGEDPNPWLEIPAGDYEGHMGSPQVGQLQMLSRLFKRALAETTPESVAVLGCATGNGFEHFDSAVTRYILGVDINPAYLAIARQWYIALQPRLELKCADLHTDCFGRRQFDLVYAGLVFEHVDAAVVLAHIYSALKPQGRLAVVLQMPNQSLSAVSHTSYKSLEKLAPTMHIFERDQFTDLANQADLHETEAEIINLPSGKAFFYAIFHKLTTDPRSLTPDSLLN